MKRKILLIIALMLALVIGISAAGCNSLGTISVTGVQDTDYIVLSNGGSAVSYGNYVYSINGFGGYEDENGKSNAFKKVEKGAIYRSELLGTSVTKNYNFSFGEVAVKSFDTKRDSSTKLKIATTTNRILTGYEIDENGEYIKDANDEYVEIRKDVEYADVQLIGPKKVGTVGNPDGGIFIFDDYIFYASPNNNKDKTGTVQTQKTDFFRAKLDGSKTELVYTSKSDTSASAYMFYKYSGSYYLVLLDGTNAVSVKMGKKVSDPINIGENVSSIYLPNKGMYYKNMPENTVEDFVYILRSPVDSDPSRLGNVLEVKRPDGRNSHVIAASGVNSVIHGASGGIFFYEVGGTIKYTNLAEITNGVMPENYDEGSTPLPIPEGVKKISSSLNFSLSAYETYKFYSLSSKNADDIFVLASNANGFYKIDRLGNARLLHDTLSSVIDVQQNYVYFTAAAGSSGSEYANSLFRADLFVEGILPEVIMGTDDVNTSVTFQYDILPDFVVYVSDIDSDATAYSFFKELENISADAQFVGFRIADETIPEEDLYPEEDDE